MNTLPLITRIFETPMGWCGMAGTSRGVCRLTFGHRSGEEVLADLGMKKRDSAETLWAHPAQRLLTDYLSHQPVDLSVIPLDLPPGTAFQERIRAIVREIPYGKTLSYGEVAIEAGYPGAARAVGTVMSTNPIPLLIPCHRVMGAHGKLGGYSAPQGLAMKRLLLDMEHDGLSIDRAVSSQLSLFVV
ncbi:MAG: methylated-DNA--[protein]-cysteine S-methyltransferase [Planctomycetaceae bacterium]|nr:methylated-DNA--[protein]-cysteine S-methyltransferase [Planctomycetaceae bacterium]